MGITVDTRRCHDCKLEKPITEFYTLKRDGLCTRCKACSSKRGKEWYAKNKLRRNAKSKAWTANHKKQHTALTKKWYEEHREERLVQCATWAKQNQDKKNIHAHNRRAKLKNCGGKFSSDDWKFLCKLARSRCLSCGIESKLTIDHIIPIELSGQNVITNIQPLCRSCNSKKHIGIVDYRSKKFKQAVVKFAQKWNLQI